MSEPSSPCVTVIVVTLNRPDCVQQCLTCLTAQEPPPAQIVVVDASPDDHTQAVCRDFPGVDYLRNPNGWGRMTASRNMGLRAATGDIIAFVDDDAFAESGWLANLLAVYADDTNGSIGAVGGRALNRQPHEATIGADKIGQLTRNGVLHGFFAADPGQVLDVAHLIGCNMSFRREVLAQLGGFRENHAGHSSLREDTDMCLRVTRLGKRIVFTPWAVVNHVGAPQAVGQRFDVRYDYYCQRNHLVLLLQNFGPLAPLVWRYLGYATTQTVFAPVRRLTAAVVRFGASLCGLTVGLGAGLRLWLTSNRDPCRREADALALRSWLTHQDE